MSIETNKAVVRRLVEEGYNQGQFIAAGELLASDFVGHDPTGEAFGRDEWRQSLLILRTTFPDYRLVIDDMIAEGDRVAWRWTMHGTDKGGLAGRPPTGKKATMCGINVECLRDGKIVESWSSSDHMPMLQALGILGNE